MYDTAISSVHSQPVGWEPTFTLTITLQRLFDKVQDVENKVRLIIDYLGIETKTKPNYHAVTVTEPANNQLHAAKTTVTNCGSSYKIPPAVKQRAVCVSTSKGNVAKNLLLEIEELTGFTSPKKAGFMCT